eukprot:515553-Prorocentrum_minimum.AAC.2
MCVGKALSHNCYTVTLPVSDEAPNWLGAGTPSAPGVTVAHYPQGRAGPGRVTDYLTRRWLDPSGVMGSAYNKVHDGRKVGISCSVNKAPCDALATLNYKKLQKFTYYSRGVAGVLSPTLAVPRSPTSRLSRHYFTTSCRESYYHLPSPLCHPTTLPPHNNTSPLYLQLRNATPPDDGAFENIPSLPLARLPLGPRQRVHLPDPLLGRLVPVERQPPQRCVPLRHPQGPLQRLHPLRLDAIAPQLQLLQRPVLRQRLRQREGPPVPRQVPVQGQLPQRRVHADRPRQRAHLKRTGSLRLGLGTVIKPLLSHSTTREFNSPPQIMADTTCPCRALAAQTTP